MTTYNAKTDWKKIDWKKLKADTKAGKVLPGSYREIEAAGAKGVKLSPEKTFRWHPGMATLQYMLVSFLHGKLHMTKVREGGLGIVPFTEEMQAICIGSLWERYLKQEEKALPEPEPIRVAV